MTLDPIRFPLEHACGVKYAECEFYGAGIGMQCRTCRMYLHPGDPGHAEIRGYYDALAKEEQDLRWSDLETGGRIGQEPESKRYLIVAPAFHGDNCDTWHFLWDYNKEPKGTFKGTISDACKACETAFKQEARLTHHTPHSRGPNPPTAPALSKEKN
jgi:hypothetical protein